MPAYKIQGTGYYCEFYIMGYAAKRSPAIAAIFVIIFASIFCAPTFIYLNDKG